MNRMTSRYLEKLKPNFNYGDAGGFADPKTVKTIEEYKAVLVEVTVQEAIEFTRRRAGPIRRSAKAMKYTIL